MAYNLIFEDDVEDDVSEAYEWYEGNAEGLGDRFLDELISCYKKLEEYPDLYSKTLKHFRKLAVNHFPYNLIFEINNNTVNIYAVFHTSRNPKALLKRIKG